METYRRGQDPTDRKGAVGLYGRVGTGWKGGGFDSRYASDSCSLMAYKSGKFLAQILVFVLSLRRSKTSFNHKKEEHNEKLRICHDGSLLHFSGQAPRICRGFR